MRVVCPSCQAVYDVPANVVAARRTMRCARCATEFAAGPGRETPPDPEPAPLPRPSPPEDVAAVSDVRIAPEDRLTASPGPPPPVGAGRKVAVLASWAISLALLAAGAWAFVAERDAIRHAWPASVRIYDLLGLTR